MNAGAEASASAPAGTAAGCAVALIAIVVRFLVVVAVVGVCRLSGAAIGRHIAATELPDAGRVCAASLGSRSSSETGTAAVMKAALNARSTRRARVVSL